MNCEMFQNLSPLEKIKFIGKLVHAAQNDEASFNRASTLIFTAETRGVFEGVEILPENPENLDEF